MRTPRDIPTRVEIIKLRDAFDHDPEGFSKRFSRKEGALRRKIDTARTAVGAVDIPTEILEKAASLCPELGTDGLRGELTLIRSARALAALKGQDVATLQHLK